MSSSPASFREAKRGDIKGEDVGQKVNPISFRLGIVKNWSSQWFAKKKDFADLLLEDVKIRKFIIEKFAHANISKVDIERTANRVRVSIFTARPGVIIGRKGVDIDRLKTDLEEMTGREIYIEIKEIKQPALEAQLVSQMIAFQLQKRIAFRRAMKKAVETAVQAGAEGIKIRCAGRLGGVEIARKESYKDGKIPLHTLRADIDYGFAEAHTTCGTIGIKTWIYKGMVKREKKEAKSNGLDAKESKI